VGVVESDSSGTTTPPGVAGYHENQVEAGEVDEVYQDDELMSSFNIYPNSALESTRRC
jgi:hypothetical protein